MGRRDPLRGNQDPVIRNLADAISAPPPVLPVDSPILRAFSVGTLVELRKTIGSIDGNSGPRAVLLAGHVTPLDAGAGVFIWDPTSTLADDATTTPSANSTVCPAVLAATKGRWRRLSLGGGGGGITQLTGDVIAGPGSGSQVATLKNIPNDTPVSGDLLMSGIAAPAAPAAGKIRFYNDSGFGAVKAIDSLGFSYVLPAVLGGPTATKWVKYIDAGGTQQLTQPVFTDISGAVSLTTQASGTLQAAQFPALTGAITTAGGSLATSVGTIPGRLVSFQHLISGTTYTRPAGVTSILVEGQGGGGGGGGCIIAGAGLFTMGAGGGAGTYGYRYYAVAPATGTYAIGASGTAGAATGAVAGNGGNTTFTDGTTLLTLPGGAGAPTNGISTAAAATLGISLGGAGGAAATNANLTTAGAPGSGAIRLSATAGQSGSGAPGHFGGNGQGRITAGAGANATANSGAGGGGGLALNSAAVVGGTGGTGWIRVWEFS